MLPRLLNILNIQCLLPLAFRRAEGPRCLTGQSPPLCGGLAGLFFEHPAQVVGPREAAQAGNDIQRVFPVQEQPHGSFHPHSGQVAPRGHPYGGGKGADKVALGDSQPLTELLHAVQASVILADILNGGLHQRRQRRGGAVGPRKLTEQGKGQLAGSPAAGCIGLGGKAAQQLSPRARNGSSVSPARNRTAACPVSWMQSRWLSPSGVRVNGARLSTRWPAAALWGGRISALPAGEGEASVRLAVHLPLEIRQTHSPSPVRVRGSLGWISRTTPRAAVLVQS